MNTDEHVSGMAKTVSCPVCGSPFECTLNASCWCARKVVPDDVRYHLASRYDTCVCNSCLDRLIRKSTTGQNLEG
ncbi:MAG: cysteine-rich CWC family protein [Chlorobiaceae bacterium]|jgi:hypothetical protein|nr:cysteine-rich CWC family protein [Chlorobiaceae bacterium]